MDHEYILVGYNNRGIDVFNATTGKRTRPLLGHDSGVWALCLISRGGTAIDPTVAFSPPRTMPDSIPSPSHSPAALLDEMDALGLGVVDDATSAEPVSSGPKFTPGNPAPFPPVGCMRLSDPAGAAIGYGQKHTIAVSAGGDRVLRVWEVTTG